MITHAYSNVQSLNYQGLQGILSLISTNEDNKMQTDYTGSHHSEQNYQHSNEKGFLAAFVLSAICLFFLKWIIENHIPTTGFINFLSLFFDDIKISIKGGYIPEIVLIAILALALFGLYVLITRLFLSAIVLSLLFAGVIYFYSDSKPENITPETLKDELVRKGLARPNENIGG